MRESQVGPLIAKFYELMREHAVFRAVFGII